MKNKKSVLTVLIILIIIVALILLVVNIFGKITDEKVNEYYKVVEDAGCDLASREGYTKAICDNFSYLCRIKYNKLINDGYLDKDLVNPLNKKKASEDTTSYVEVIWQDGQMSCKHKEG